MRLLHAIALLLACVIATTSARECYACRAKKDIAGITFSADLTNRLNAFQTCEVMDDEGPSDKFKQKCLASDKGCVNIVDPNDKTNRLRSCFPLDKNECQKTACYCTGELCNAGATAWASVVGVAAGLMAVLAGR